jgi:hypothetical protein
MRALRKPIDFSSTTLHSHWAVLDLEREALVSAVYFFCSLVASLTMLDFAASAAAGAAAESAGFIASAAGFIASAAGFMASVAGAGDGAGAGAGATAGAGAGAAGFLSSPHAVNATATIAAIRIDLFIVCVLGTCSVGSYGRNPDEPDRLIGSATTEKGDSSTKTIEFKGMANIDDQVAVQPAAGSVY